MDISHGLGTIKHRSMVYQRYLLGGSSQEEPRQSENISAKKCCIYRSARRTRCTHVRQTIEQPFATLDPSQEYLLSFPPVNFLLSEPHAPAPCNVFLLLFAGFGRRLHTDRVGFNRRHSHVPIRIPTPSQMAPWAESSTWQAPLVLLATLWPRGRGGVGVKDPPPRANSLAAWRPFTRSERQRSLR